MYDTITLRPEKRLGLKISLDSCLFLSHHHWLLHHHLPFFSNMIIGHFVGAEGTWARSSMDTKVIIDREVWGPRETSLSIDIHWPFYWFSITWRKHREIRKGERDLVWFFSLHACLLRCLYLRSLPSSLSTGDTDGKKKKRFSQERGLSREGNFSSSAQVKCQGWLYREDREDDRKKETHSMSSRQSHVHLLLLRDSS